MEKFVAITGDIVQSRLAPNRQSLQDELFSTLHKTNNNLQGDIVVPLNITIGDEFQGLFKSLATSLDCVLEMEKALYPLVVRFGVGRGTISTSITQTTAHMDGECFHLSREALQEAKKFKRSVVFKTQNPDFDKVVNTIVMLVDAIKSEWKEQHYRRFWLYEELGSMEEVAQRENVSVHSIWKSLDKAKYEAILEAREALKFFLQSGN